MKKVTVTFKKQAPGTQSKIRGLCFVVCGHPMIATWRALYSQAMHHSIFCQKVTIKYRKTPEISLATYIFQRPFLRRLFLEGLIFGGAYLWREICISKSIGLALYLEVNLPFLLCFTLYLRAIFQVQAARGLWRGNLTEGFLRYQFGGLINLFGGAYTWTGFIQKIATIFQGLRTTYWEYNFTDCTKMHISSLF